MATGRSIVVTRALSRVSEKLEIVNGTAHDLQRTGASMMASERCGVRGEVIARILNHTPLGSPVTQIYNLYDYAAEKRAALELWADTILKMAAPKQLMSPQKRKPQLIVAAEAIGCQRSKV
jgi:integrase